MVLLVNVLIQEWEVNKPKQRTQRKAGSELCRKGTWGNITQNCCWGLAHAPSNITILEQWDKSVGVLVSLSVLNIVALLN